MKIMNQEVSKLRAGMKLYEDLFNPNGVFVLAKDTVLDDGHIQKIENNHIQKVKVCILGEAESLFEDGSPIISIFDQKKAARFREKYIEKVDELVDVIKDIGKGKAASFSQINTISKHIINEFDTQSEVINYLHLVKPLDDYTYAHSLSVSLISIIIAKWMKLSEEMIDLVATAGLVHDIGKTRVSQELLAKPGKLTPSEFEEIKEHTVRGYRILQDIGDATKDVRFAALMHHEKIDGSGYPTGAKDNQIPLLAKIISIADIYDAMTSDRSYRKKICPFEVIKNFDVQTYGKLDTQVLTVFLKNIANSYNGDYVELNTGEIAQIVFINQNMVWLPIVKSGEQYIDLSNQRGKISIKEIV